MVKNREKEHLLGLMEARIKEIFMKTIFMVGVFIVGLMEEYITGLGNAIKCMDMESSRGPMVENMKESMLMTKNKEKECFNGLMEGSILVVGIMGNNMVREFIFLRVVMKEKESGRLGKGLSG